VASRAAAARRKRGPVALRPRLSPGVLFSMAGLNRRANVGRRTGAVNTDREGVRDLPGYAWLDVPGEVLHVADHEIEFTENDRRVAFNRSKAHVQAFVRDTLGDDHALYRAVTKVPALKVTGEPEQRAQQPEALATMLLRLPDVHRRIAWSLAVTGLRPKEFFPQTDGSEASRSGWRTQGSPGVGGKSTLLTPRVT
jgi:hypothetical protein